MNRGSFYEELVGGRYSILQLTELILRNRTTGLTTDNMCPEQGFPSIYSSNSPITATSKTRKEADTVFFLCAHESRPQPNLNQNLVG